MDDGGEQSTTSGPHESAFLKRRIDSIALTRIIFIGGVARPGANCREEHGLK